MMKKVTALFFLLVLSACKPQITKEDISKINGYWEIEKVLLADGSEKDYGINVTYDYIHIENNEGFRKKVKHQLNGKYLVDDTSEKVSVINQDDKVYLNYTTPYAKWKEELKSVSDKEMVIVNQAKNEYHYKRAEALNLDSYGKKNK